MKARLEAFADGVFAIAITLLVLELHVPRDGPLLAGLLDQWASFAAYVASFLHIGIYWMAHHITSTYVVRVDGKLLFANLIFLMTVAFIPFPTALAAERVGAGVDTAEAMVVYGVAMLLVAVMANVILLVIFRGGLMDRAAFAREAPVALARRYWLGPVIYAVAIAVALAQPLVALLFYVLAPLYYGLETTKWRPRAAATP